MRTDNPIADAQSYFRNDFETEVKTYKACQVDRCYYDINEMVFDKLANGYIAFGNLNEYLEICEKEMLAEDFETLKTNLLKQSNNY